MKIATFPRLLKWMFTTGLTLLLLMTVMRFIFFFHFKPSQYSFSNCIKPFILGLRYDLRIVCAIVLIPFLAGSLHLDYTEKNRLRKSSIFRLVLVLILLTVIILLLKNNHAGIFSIIAVSLVFTLYFLWAFATKNCNPFINKTSKKVFKIYFLIVCISLAFLYAMDFEHYDYLHQRLNASVLNYAEDASISMNMVWETYPVFTIIFLLIVSSVLLYWLISIYYRLFKKYRYNGHGIIRIILGFTFTFILALGIFGRLNQYPLRWSDAFSFDDEFKASLALNPIQSFLSTLQFRSSTYDKNKVKEYYPLMAQYLGVANPDSSTLNFTRTFTPSSASSNTPNVVVVICESFSAYKSSMWGNPLNTTPFFNEMCKQGIFFDRCFTPAYGTARGIWAVITGIPDIEYPNTSSRNPAYVDQHSIINDYKGYEKLYFLGGSSSWANVRGLLTNNITGLHLFEEDSYKAKSIDVWGISDKQLFLEANNTLSEQIHPFIAVIQTADNHRPYTIPEEDKNEFIKKTYSTDSLKRFGFESNAELNAFRYTDFSFEKFIEAARKEKYFDNTIFVFVGDHGIRGDAGDMFPKAWTVDGLTNQHVPLLFYSPSRLQPQRIDKTCSQVDLLPSVTALAGIPYTNTTMGKNLFDTTQNNSLHFKNTAFVYDYNIKQIGVVTDEYVYVHNLLSGTEDFRSSINNVALMQNPATDETEKTLRTLTQAYYETARYMLLNNKKQRIAK
ncbi:MAG: LTA synthase family protein [Bacteroidota bacterium]|nr:LTA synthase family protein [Bacteroidota bacterium]